MTTWWATRPLEPALVVLTGAERVGCPEGAALGRKAPRTCIHELNASRLASLIGALRGARTRTRILIVTTLLHAGGDDENVMPPEDPWGLLLA